MTQTHKKKSIIELTRCSAEEYRGMRKMPLAVMADNIRSLHNVGSLFRTCDAFLVEELVLAGISGCPPHAEISKTALGAEESVVWRHVGSAVEEALRFRAAGWRICVLEQAHDSVPLQRFRIEPSGRYLLIVGNEVEGVDQRLVDLADHILEIPQCGVKHSLNVSVSGGIALWHLFSQMISSSDE